MLNHVNRYLKALAPRFTAPANRRHNCCAAVNPAAEFDSSNKLGGQPPHAAIVLSEMPSHAFMAGRAGAPTGAPVPSFRSVNLALARPPRLTARCGNTNRKLGGLTMATTTTRRTRAKITPTIELDSILSVSESRAVYKALRILDAKLQHDDGTLLNSPSVTGPYFACKLGGLAAEAFAVAYLDARNRVIDTRVVFTGTLTQTAVHPRVIVKTALELGAAAAIVAHNHPGGSLVFSDADKTLTFALARALATIDVRLHDHILVAGGQTLSGAATGLI